MLLALSAKNRRTAVTKSMQPTSIMLPPKSCSSCSSKNSPTITAGIIEIIIFPAKRWSSLIPGLNKPFIISIISFLKITMVLNAVAK